MIEETISYMLRKDIKVENGDLVFCLIDSDEISNKNKQIIEAKKKAKKCGIEIIVSNPCFEDWFLCHFKYTTKEFTNTKILDELRKYIPEYEKNLNVYSLLADKIDKAISNAKKQIKYQVEKNCEIGTVEANPSTEVYKIVEIIRKLEDRM